MSNIGFTETQLKITEDPTTGLATGDREFGKTVAVSGNYAAVSYQRHTSGSSTKKNCVYIYKKNGENWELHQRLEGQDPSYDEFGAHPGSIAMAGDILAIGARKYYTDLANRASTEKGGIYIFKLNSDGEYEAHNPTGGNGLHTIPDGEFAGDLYGPDASANVFGDGGSNSQGMGYELDIWYNGTNEYRLVGARQGDRNIDFLRLDMNNESAGWEYFYKRIDNSNQANVGNRTISIYENTIAIGDPHGSSSGGGRSWAQILTYNGNGWSESNIVNEVWLRRDGDEHSVNYSPTQANSYFGNDISVYKDTIVVGARTNEVYIFNKNGDGTWGNDGGLYSDDAGVSTSWRPTQRYRIANVVITKPATSLANGAFGKSVKLKHDTLLFISDENRRVDNKNHVGSIYLYELKNGTWTENTNNQAYPVIPSGAGVGTANWSQASSVPFFGKTLDFDGTTLIGGGSSYNNNTTSDGVSTYTGLASLFLVAGVPLTAEEIVSAAETELTAELDVPNAVVTSMKAVVSVAEGGIKKVTIASNIKDSIVKTSSGVKETKQNMRKKRREFLKILFANNAADTIIKMSTADIGLDETLKNTLGTKEIKENVKVLKKNVETAIVVSTETSADTGVYAELGNKDDFVKFDVNGITDIKVTKTQDASSNGNVDQWTVNYNSVDYVKEEGEKITINGYTIYIGSVYIDGDSAGIPASGQVFDLKFAKIPLDADDNPNITRFSSNDKIRQDRHSALATIWNENPVSTNFLTNSSDLGLNRTVGKPIKNTVNVYKADQTVNLDDVSIINKNTGVYADLSGVNDFVRFNSSQGDFVVKVKNITPVKKYVLQDTNGDNISDIEFRDGQWTTHNGITVYFGGVYTSGTNDGITAADPYVFPINGNPYKLPDKVANYCLYADDNTFITGMVRQLSLVEQEKMREWVIERVGSDTNNGASLVTDGYFYSAVHVNTNVGELYLDMENKVCNTNNKGSFNVTFKESKDKTYLFKGEHKTTATISWNDNGNSMAIDVDFFNNPQIRNGIKMNTIITKSNPIGLLVDDYEPSLLTVKNPKNKLSKYHRLLEKLGSGKRVKGDKLNLQKDNELWSRHNMQ